ncbi:MAG TPA: hypothetical protein VFV33_00715 [Gemmatimonadaceae bacterium]|nr:hypothetical protein [Gemmatimonadaceae bacterium]
MPNRSARMRALAWTAIAFALVGSVGACSHDSSIAKALRNRSVKGRYVYAGQGSTMTIPWRFNAALALDGRGAYVLDIDVQVRGEGERGTTRGTYAVSDGVLRLTPTKERGTSHELLIRGDSLMAETDLGGSVLLRLAGVPKPVFVRER